MGRTLGYDDSGFAPFFNEGSLVVYRYVDPFGGCTPGVDCDWIPLPTLARDLVANTITVSATGFSQLVLGGAPIGPSSWQLAGTATGGSVDFAIGAVSLQVVTSAGESADIVAAAVASAINANQALSAAGITAHSSAGTVATDGSLTFREINDPGLRAVIPSLALWGGMLLAGLLAALGVRLNRKWGRV